MTPHRPPLAAAPLPRRFRAGATPVFHASGLATPAGELWIKNDGLTSSLYGGNKVRKLELILDHALERGARRLVTIGAAGSHHALATTVFGKALGLRVAAVLGPQHASEHAKRTLADALALGLDARPARSTAEIPLVVMRTLRPGDYLIPPGGSTSRGTLGYAAAIVELAEQIRAGELPQPDLVVVAVGSGGTAAGLLAGVCRSSIATRIVGVRVGGYAPLTRPLVLSLAAMALRAANPPLEAAELRELSQRLDVEHAYLGPGYGAPSREAELALDVGHALGLELDITYTAKAFAKALELVGHPALMSLRRRAGPNHNRSRDLTGRPLRVLYWHTLSAVRPATPDGGGQSPRDLPLALAELFIRGER